MYRPTILVVVLAAGISLAAIAGASHKPGGGCQDCASHKYWPTIDGTTQIARDGKSRNATRRSVRYVGTGRSDELLGGHGSDVLSGRDGSDVLWGDYDPKNQPSGQHDRIYGGDGTDFIYGSHGRNTIRAGAGNDVISVHYGRGFVDCGPGRDIYHVARKRRKNYKFRNCEKVDYRPERLRGPLKPLR